jgi:hypothetical protein
MGQQELIMNQEEAARRGMIRQGTKTTRIPYPGGGDAEAAQSLDLRRRFSEGFSVP